MKAEPPYPTLTAWATLNFTPQPCLQLHFRVRSSFCNRASITTLTLSSVHSPTNSLLHRSNPMSDSTVHSRKRQRPNLQLAVALVHCLPVLRSPVKFRKLTWILPRGRVTSRPRICDCATGFLTISKRYLNLDSNWSMKCWVNLWLSLVIVFGCFDLDFVFCFGLLRGLGVAVVWIWGDWFSGSWVGGIVH